MHNLQRGRKSVENNKNVKALPRGLFASAELSYVCKECVVLSSYQKWTATTTTRRCCRDAVQGQTLLEEWGGDTKKALLMRSYLQN